MATALRKNVAILDQNSINKLKDVLLSNDSAKVEDLLVKLYYHTFDQIQRILIEEICRLRGISLVEDSQITA